MVKGSHRWEKLVRPLKWLNEDSFYSDDSRFMELPDIDGRPDDFEVLSWALEPGDSVLFSYKTLHGAKGNLTANRRRAFSHRWVGDDVRLWTRLCVGVGRLVCRLGVRDGVRDCTLAWVGEVRERD